MANTVLKTFLYIEIKQTFETFDNTNNCLLNWFVSVVLKLLLVLWNIHDLTNVIFNIIFNKIKFIGTKLIGNIIPLTYL